jgi:hypothetical protein
MIDRKRIASPILALAATEYRWLLDRGYAESASLKLVGDRHQMTRDERMILFRGVASSEASSSRAAIIRFETEGREILVDGYNQALTVMHYLSGRPLFIGTDGLTRDAGGSHGRIADAATFGWAVGVLVDRISRSSPSRVAVFLDAPVPGSAGHAGLFRDLLAADGVDAEVRLERSADGPLKAAPHRSFVATSDSAIVDALAASAPAPRPENHGAAIDDGPWIYDAARWAIELAFGKAELLDLRRLLAKCAASDIDAR